MYKILTGLFFLLVISYQLGAQIFPQGNAQLYYRIIGFSFPALPNADSYTIEIAKGNYNSESALEKNKVATVTGKKNKIIAEVPSFGCEYSWRIISGSSSNKQLQIKSQIYHFSVKIMPDVDPRITRIRITKSAEKYKDCYIFIDDTRALYDMKGNPVWFLPGADMQGSKDARPRNITATPDGTLTFITGWQPYEITYSGNVLWNYYVNKDVGQFHHEFTKLSSGHYMGMLLEDISGKLPEASNDRVFKDVYDSVGFYRSRIYSTIVEFDKNKRIVWRWSGLDYVNNSDLGLRRTADVPDLDCDLRENSFFFDEKNKVIYLSFRNINRVIKIKYPEGKVLNTYGTLYKPGLKSMENGLFNYQHSCKRSQKGYLYMFNNNSSGSNHIPTIVMFQEPGSGKSDLKKVWEYQCTIEGMDNATISKMYFHTSGGVTELPDQSILVNMGKPYPKIFIVGHNKKILWSAMPEKYNSATKKWEMFDDLYRISMISRKELEKLIWASER